eukprot:9858916-Heterocapsa_arctica.AAC.1
MEMGQALSASQAEEEARNQWDLGPAPSATSPTPLATDVPAGQKIDYCVTKICTACRAFFLPPGPPDGICPTCGEFVSGPGSGTPPAVWND